MFESHSDKGLFTFYWEQSHPLPVPQTPREQTGQQTEHDENVKQERRQNKSKKTTNKFNHHHKQAKNRIKVHLKHSMPEKKYHKEKDKYVSMNPINLNDSLASYEPGRFVLKSIKQNETQKKKNCELPQLRKITTLRKDEQNGDILTQLIEKEEKHTPNTLKLEFKELRNQQNKKKSTGRVKKLFKQHTTVINSPYNSGKQTDRLTHVQSNIHLAHDLSAHRLPTLTIHPKPHKRASKEPCFIQKMIQERQIMDRSDSVVTLGLSRMENYEDRYQKRKDEFMRLLQINVLKQLPPA